MIDVEKTNKLHRLKFTFHIGQSESGYYSSTKIIPHSLWFQKNSSWKLLSTWRPGYSYEGHSCNLTQRIFQGMHEKSTQQQAEWEKMWYSLDIENGGYICQGQQRQEGSDNQHKVYYSLLHCCSAQAHLSGFVAAYFACPFQPSTSSLFQHFHWGILSSSDNLSPQDDLGAINSLKCIKSLIILAVLLNYMPL